MNTKEGKQLEKQECVVGDITACSRLVLWDKDVGTLTKDISYKLLNVTEISFDDMKYLHCITKQAFQSC